MTQRIIYTSPEGNVCVVVPAPGYTAEFCMKDVPAVTLDLPEIVPVEDIPADRTFRNAWKRGEQGKRVGVEMVKAKEITHGRRRDKRAAEFAPHDAIIMMQIPGASAAIAEQARTAIRAKFDAMQVEVDACGTPEALKAIIAREVL